MFQVSLIQTAKCLPIYRAFAWTGVLTAVPIISDGSGSCAEMDCQDD